MIDGLAVTDQVRSRLRHQRGEPGDKVLRLRNAAFQRDHAVRPCTASEDGAAIGACGETSGMTIPRNHLEIT